jgi:antibiotic biosynthesis monooxygenase (ABM) superfamily enzyme
MPDPEKMKEPLLARVVITLGAWLVAFLVVTSILSVFRDELESMPLALRALVISGVLVALMANLVMPVLSAAVARWISGSGPTKGSSDEAISAAL